MFISSLPSWLLATRRLAALCQNHVSSTVHGRIIIAPAPAVDDERDAGGRLPHRQVVVQDQEVGVDRSQRLRQIARQLLGANVVRRGKPALRRGHAIPAIDRRGCAMRVDVSGNERQARGRPRRGRRRIVFDGSHNGGTRQTAQEPPGNGLRTR